MIKGIGKTVGSVCVLGAFAFGPTLAEGSINYGNFGPIPPGISFLGVTESSGTDALPLYGPPSPYAVGLDFDPASFTATSVAGGADLTDGQLNFIVAGAVTQNLIVGISDLSLFEAGDYSLFGVGTAATEVLAGAIIRITVTEIDGLAVVPVVLVPVNASVGFNLPANPGVVQPWSLGVFVDIDNQLTALGYSYIAGATRVSVAINNTLAAASEPASGAFIAKKEFIIDVTSNPVPEPASMAVIGLVGAALLGRRRRI